LVMLLFFYSSISFSFILTAATNIYTLSLHDALPIWSATLNLNHAANTIWRPSSASRTWPISRPKGLSAFPRSRASSMSLQDACRSEEHTSELQSRENLVCRLLLEKKKTIILWMHLYY